LKRSVPGGYLVELQVRGDVAQPFVTALQLLPGVVDVKTENNRVRVYADHAEGLLASAMRAAAEQDVMITDAHVAEPSLENLFLHLTGRSLRE
jgi:ABC-2 type transport system ATP-binding protein